MTNKEGEPVYDSGEKYMKIVYYSLSKGVPSHLPTNTAVVIPPLSDKSPGGGGSWGQLLVENSLIRSKVNWAEGLTALGVYNVYLPVMVLDVSGL